MREHVLLFEALMYFLFCQTAGYLFVGRGRFLKLELFLQVFRQGEAVLQRLQEQGKLDGAIQVSG